MKRPPPGVDSGCQGRCWHKWASWLKTNKQQTQNIHPHWHRPGQRDSWGASAGMGQARLSLDLGHSDAPILVRGGGSPGERKALFPINKVTRYKVTNLQPVTWVLGTSSRASGGHGFHKDLRDEWQHGQACSSSCFPSLANRASCLPGCPWPPQQYLREDGEKERKKTPGGKCRHSQMPYHLIVSLCVATAVYHDKRWL